MSEHVIKLPDVGEGVAEAEIVELMVKVGEPVREGDVLAAVMTDKATVEIPSPADGRVSWIGWEVGQKAAVGSELMKIEIGDGADTRREPALRAKDAVPADRAGEQPQRSQRSKPARAAFSASVRRDGAAADRDPRGFKNAAARSRAAHPRPISRPAARCSVRSCARP